MKLFIGCSASEYIPNKYTDDCKMFLEKLFEYEHDLVFGCCSKGLMGLSYDIVKNNGGSVFGVYPNVYRKEAVCLDCGKVSTKTIPMRTDRVIKDSDVLIFMPGGIGTVYELFTAIECRRAYEFVKPIIIYNSCGYFDKLLEFLELTYDDNFALRDIKDYYYICSDADDCLNYIDRYYCMETKKRKKEQK